MIENPQAVIADLARVKTMFQARTIALVLGAEPPSPELFASETNKDRNAKEERP
jgi:hypothetical protein